MGMNGSAFRIFAHYVIGDGPTRPQRVVVAGSSVERTPAGSAAVINSPVSAPVTRTELVTCVSPDHQAMPVVIEASPTPAVDVISKDASTATDAAILAILDAPRDYGDSVSAAFARKERELAMAFRTLAPSDARALHRRLADPRADDAVAARFKLLIVERRDRLLAVINNAMRSGGVVAAGRAA
jgi:hypothetical protein